MSNTFIHPCSVLTEFWFQLDKLNNDPNVHGIIVQMPLDSENKIDSDLVTDYVSAEKDVDGYVKSNCIIVSLTL